MAENNQTQFQCTGNCLACTPVQRQYCACQHSYTTMRTIQQIEESLKAMSGTVEELKVKITAIQDSEAMVFDPNSETLVGTSLPITTTQEGVGV